jgi:hypothetical protein
MDLGSRDIKESELHTYALLLSVFVRLHHFFTIREGDRRSAGCWFYVLGERGRMKVW